jgi:hypothetical protein
MVAFSKAATMSRLCGAVTMQPKHLWSLLFRILPKLLSLLASLLKKFQKEGLVEFDTAMGTLPELPQDVLMSIFCTLDVPDLVRAGSVCSSWHAAYTCLRDLGKYKQSQTPCLFYTSESAGDNVGLLYSLKENRSYKLTLPEPSIRSRFLIGSSNGWLITADERSELHLVNPITGEQVALPSVMTIEHVKPIFDVSGTIHKYELSYDIGKVYTPPSLHDPSDLREYLYFKAFVFPDPSTGSYIVVLIHDPYLQISFARPGDDKWTWLGQGHPYKDCIYMDGLLYALDYFGEIDAFDLTASPVKMTVIMDELECPTCESMYIIQAPWGDLLQVWRTVEFPPNAPWYVPGQCRAQTLKTKVYKVDLEAKQLMEINRLPCHILFLGHNDSLCLSAEGHPGLKSNHAYFTDDHKELTVGYKNGTRDMGVMDLENSVKKEIASQIWSNWPCPTWITPNLMKLNLAFGK